MPGQNFDSKRRITVRNLRIREDTAKVRDTSGNAGLSLCWTVILLLFLTVMILIFRWWTMGLCLCLLLKLLIEARDEVLLLTQRRPIIWTSCFSQYLRNLDPNSAYYDPKTRAMRENPYSNTGMNPDEWVTVPVFPDHSNVLTGLHWNNV